MNIKSWFYKKKNSIGVEHKHSPLSNRSFCVMAFLALLLPDLLLRTIINPCIYSGVLHIILGAFLIPTLFNILWIGLFFLVTQIFLSKKWGRILYLSIGIVFFILGVSQYVYYGIFGQFFRLGSIGLAGEGANYLSFVLSYIDIRLILYLVIQIRTFILVARNWHRIIPEKKLTKTFILVPIALLVLLHICMQPSEKSLKAWDSWARPTVVYDDFTDTTRSLNVTGIYQFAFRDIYKTNFDVPEYSTGDRHIVEEFFNENKKNWSPNEYTGYFEGKNVIAIMLESIDDWLVTDENMPALKYMMNNGINLSNHYAPPFGTGLTLASEFCFHTGYYTPMSGISSVNYSENTFPYAIPNLFAAKGYSVNSFHYNNKDFYNRGVIHHGMGYEKYNSFMDDYDLSEDEAQLDSNILNHGEIFNDMVKDEPFFSFVITYSAHLPYDDPDDPKLLSALEKYPEMIDPEMDPETNNCFILARDTDVFLRMLLEKLYACGKLEDTVIIGFTDHDTYGFSDHELMLEYSINAGCENTHRVPAFIFNYGTEPLNITKPTKTADLAPTLINLFGLENHHCYIGNDIFDPQNRGFVYFSDNSWIDGDMVFSSGSEDEETAQHTENHQRVQKLKEINDIVIAGDYFAEKKE